MQDTLTWLTLISTSCLNTVSSSGATASDSDVVAISDVGNPDAMAAVRSVSTTDDRMETSDKWVTISQKVQHICNVITFIVARTAVLPSDRLQMANQEY